MTLRRMLDRRLRELEAFTRRGADLPPWLVVTVQDSSVRRDPDAEPADAPASVPSDVVTVDGRIVERQAGETDEALFARAAALHPRAGALDTVPVLTYWPRRP